MSIGMREALAPVVRALEVIAELLRGITAVQVRHTELLEQLVASNVTPLVKPTPKRAPK